MLLKKEFLLTGTLTLTLSSDLMESGLNYDSELEVKESIVPNYYTADS